MNKEVKDSFAFLRRYWRWVATITALLIAGYWILWNIVAFMIVLVMMIIIVWVNMAAIEKLIARWKP